MYNYNHLYYFYITVKSGGVTSAAKHLSISQPSLSGQLKVLEEFLQVKLFKRIGRKNGLTTEGANIFGFCRQMFELSEQMHDSITEKVPHASRRIYVGVSREIPNSFVMEVISHFLAQYSTHPKPKVTMISGSHERLTEQLRFKEIDVLITQNPATASDLSDLQQVDIPVCLISKFNKRTESVVRHALLEDVLSHLASAKSLQWTMPSQELRLRSEINHYMEANAIKGKVVFESDVIESLIRSVIEDIGVAFLPLVYVAKELQAKTLSAIGPEEGYWKHTVCLTSHLSNPDDQLITNLSQSFKNICHKLIQTEERTIS